MDFPIGSELEVTVDMSHTLQYFANDSKHRARKSDVLRGVVVGAPSWLKGPHVCLLNSETKALNLVPEHRIVAINDKPVKPKAPIKDRVYNVTSSKTGEVYIVQLNSQTRLWSCTCTGWQFHKKCRHTVRCELQAELVIVSDSQTEE
jgi:hypothetical protein